MAPQEGSLPALWPSVILGAMGEVRGDTHRPGEQPKDSFLFSSVDQKKYELMAGLMATGSVWPNYPTR